MPLKGHRRKQEKDNKAVITSRKAKLEEERNYELVTRKRRETGTFVKSFLRFLFSQVGMVVVVLVVALVGAEIFLSLEYDREMERRDEKMERARDVDEATNYLSNAIWWYIKDTDTYNYSRPQFEDVVEARLTDYIEFVINATKEVNYDGTVEGWDTAWTFPNALLFTISIMTLIGYGHIAPATLNGMIFCMLYSLIAIMVFVAMLANVSSGIVSAIVYTYSRCCCRWFRSERLKSEIPSRSLRKKLRRRLIDEEVGDELYMPTSQIGIPIIVNIVLIFGYIFIGAMLFSAWEGWSFTDAIYFSFITLSTIGFGDLTPTQSFAGATKGAKFGDFMRMVGATIYCSVGLAVLSICLALIQEQIAKRAARALNKNQEKILMDKCVILPRRTDIDVPSDFETGKKEAVLAGATSASDEWEEVEEDDQVTYIYDSRRPSQMPNGNEDDEDDDGFDGLEDLEEVDEEEDEGDNPGSRPETTKSSKSNAEEEEKEDSEEEEEENEDEIE